MVKVPKQTNKKEEKNAKPIFISFFHHFSKAAVSASGTFLLSALALYSVFLI